MKASKKAKREYLYELRLKHRLTQAEIAAMLGVSRQVYAYIEQGKRSGSADFWAAIQRVFAVKDEDMYKLMKIKEQVEE